MSRRPVIAGNWKMHHDHLVAIQVVQKLSYRLDKADYEASATSWCAHRSPTCGRSRRSSRATRSRSRSARRTATGRTRARSPVRSARRCSPSSTWSTSSSGTPSAASSSARPTRWSTAKTKAVLKHGMTPIVCVGETLEERERGATDERVIDQIAGAFTGIRTADAERCVVAYEPIWAIGTGRNATPDDANDTIGVIRDALRSLFAGTADEIRIQYGGSVKPGNIADLMAMPEIDGALVGGASLDPDEFARIVQYRR